MGTVFSQIESLQLHGFEKYSGSLDDVFDIQEKVSRSIVDALKLRLTTSEKQEIARRPIDDVQAYECYLLARQQILGLSEEGTFDISFNGK